MENTIFSDYRSRVHSSFCSTMTDEESSSIAFFESNAVSDSNLNYLKEEILSYCSIFLKYDKAQLKIPFILMSKLIIKVEENRRLFNLKLKRRIKVIEAKLDKMMVKVSSSKFNRRDFAKIGSMNLDVEAAKSLLFSEKKNISVAEEILACFFSLVSNCKCSKCLVDEVIEQNGFISSIEEELVTLRERRNKLIREKVFLSSFENLKDSGKRVEYRNLKRLISACKKDINKNVGELENYMWKFSPCYHCVNKFKFREENFIRDVFYTNTFGYCNKYNWYKEEYEGIVFLNDDDKHTIKGTAEGEIEIIDLCCRDFEINSENIFDLYNFTSSVKITRLGVRVKIMRADTVVFNKSYTCSLDKAMTVLHCFSIFEYIGGVFFLKGSSCHLGSVDDFMHTCLNGKLVLKRLVSPVIFYGDIEVIGEKIITSLNFQGSFDKLVSVNGGIEFKVDKDFLPLLEKKYDEETAGSIYNYTREFWANEQSLIIPSFKFIVSYNTCSKSREICKGRNWQRKRYCNDICYILNRCGYNRMFYYDCKIPPTSICRRHLDHCSFKERNVFFCKTVRPGAPPLNVIKEIKKRIIYNKKSMVLNDRLENSKQSFLESVYRKRVFAVATHKERVEGLIDMENKSYKMLPKASYKAALLKPVDCSKFFANLKCKVKSFFNMINPKVMDDTEAAVKDCRIKLEKLECLVKEVEGVGFDKGGGVEFQDVKQKNGGRKAKKPDFQFLNFDPVPLSNTYEVLKEVNSVNNENFEILEKENMKNGGKDMAPQPSELNQIASCLFSEIYLLRKKKKLDHMIGRAACNVALKRNKPKSKKRKNKFRGSKIKMEREKFINPLVNKKEKKEIREKMMINWEPIRQNFNVFKRGVISGYLTRMLRKTLNHPGVTIKKEFSILEDVKKNLVFYDLRGLKVINKAIEIVDLTKNTGGESGEGQAAGESSKPKMTKRQLKNLSKLKKKGDYGSIEEAILAKEKNNRITKENIEKKVARTRKQREEEIRYMDELRMSYSKKE